MLKVVSKYHDVYGKFVVIAQENEPNLTILPAVFDEDFSHLTEVELVDKVLDYTFKLYFAGKLANETAQQVEDLDKKMAQVDDFLKKAEQQMDGIEKRSKTVQGGLIELSTTVYNHEDRITVLEGGEPLDEGIEATDDLVDNAHLEM